MVAHQPAVGRLRHLVLLLWASVMDLLQQVVLLLTHHQLSSFLLALLELILQRLRINADAPVRHDLLASVRRNAYSDTAGVRAVDP